MAEENKYLTEEALLRILSANNKKEKAASGYGELWVEACRHANEVISVYDGSQDKSVVGKKPEFDRLREMLFKSLVDKWLREVSS